MVAAFVYLLHEEPQYLCDRPPFRIARRQTVLAEPGATKLYTLTPDYLCVAALVDVGLCALDGATDSPFTQSL
jgi:hypothetical protein